ncbi:MAG: DUF4956 domain-containing protein [Candidatus Krumholzibacteria bacterium]|nr:DUF4956 domain-containing protein [Candidatus Krumholzibacteria bacterium]
MNRLQTFQEFLVTTSVQVPVVAFIVNVLLAALLSYLLGLVYARFGTSLSSRRRFGKNFMMLTMTTTLIISIVKSSLALSLGLVGALSIVRFRAAIKEPEELAYLFLAIGIGLGMGADQARITVVAFVLIILLLIIRGSLSRKAEDNHNLHLTVYSHNPKKLELNEIIDTLKARCSAVDLKRFDETKEEIEASFLVEFTDTEQLKQTTAALQQLSDSVKVSFLDHKGLV